jgi:hypothetical protein
MKPGAYDQVSELVCRFVRQDDDLWDAAHAGVLTTGMLKEALGFLDPPVARVLALPKAMHSPGAIQKVSTGNCTLHSVVSTMSLKQGITPLTLSNLGTES